MSYKVDFPCYVALLVGDYKTSASDPASDDYDSEKTYMFYAIISQQYHNKDYYVLDLNGGKPVYPETKDRLLALLNGFREGDYQ